MPYTSMLSIVFFFLQIYFFVFCNHLMKLTKVCAASPYLWWLGTVVYGDAGGRKRQEEAR